MRWPRLLSRRRDPHTTVITGVKAAVRAGDLPAINKLVRQYGHTARWSESFTSELSQIITGRVTDDLPHAEATNRCEALAGTVPAGTDAETWFTLENLSRTIGCFVASHRFTEGGMAALLQSARADRQFLAHLHQGDLEGARSAWSRRDGSAWWADAGHYLWLCSRGAAGEPAWSPDESWTKALRGHPVVILGPAPTSLGTTKLGSETLVARVIMQGVLEWDQAKDPLKGQCDLAYANRETRNWIRDNALWGDLSRFTAVSFRIDQSAEEWAALGENLRSAHDPRRLMVGGSSANMIPLMVWDILRVPEVSLTVGGTTFFASQTAYTDTNRRFKHTVGKATDQIGSTGSLFERCPTFARHNVTENWMLVKNLAVAGAISVDDECRRVVELSAEEYLAELDELYGKDRR